MEVHYIEFSLALYFCLVKCMKIVLYCKVQSQTKSVSSTLYNIIEEMHRINSRLLRDVQEISRIYLLEQSVHVKVNPKS